MIPVRDLPPPRKAVHYIAMIMIGVGFLVFLSAILVMTESEPKRSTDEFFRDPRGYMDRQSREFDTKSSAAGKRVFIGFGLVIVGGILSGVARSGSGGGGGEIGDESGEITQTWSMARDPRLDAAQNPPPMPDVKVRCKSCQALNEETQKFCGQCGHAL